jgi:hypothetical protein
MYIFKYMANFTPSPERCLRSGEEGRIADFAVEYMIRVNGME